MKRNSYGGYGWCAFLVAGSLFQVMAEDSTTTAMQLDSLRADSTQKPVVHQLDRMVVTATRTPKKQENVPATVTVIHPEDIEVTPAQTVGDLLGTLPGVEASEPQGVGMVTPQSLRIRGNGFPGHALILLDGQPINTPYTGYAYVTTVPVRAVRNIEVVRGAYSALYGSSAGGGIVNISTKDGNDGSYIEPWGKIGDFGRHDFGCDLGLSLGDFSLGAFYDHKNTDNVYLYDDYLYSDLKSDTANRDHRHDRVHANLRYDLSEKTTFNLSGGFTRGVTGFGISDELQLHNHQLVIQPYANLRSVMHATERLNIHAQLDWIRSHHNYHGETLDNIIREVSQPTEFVYKASLNDTRADRFRGLADASYSFTKNQIFIGGIEGSVSSATKAIIDVNADTLLNVQGRPGEIGEESDYQASVFAQYDGTFWKRFETVIGCRLDYYGDWGLQFSPKAALRLRMLDGMGLVDILDAKVSAGRGFRAPSLSELHSPPWSIYPFMLYQGNPELLPEELWAFEGAIEGKFMGRSVRCRVAPYLTLAENFVESKNYPDPYNPTGRIMQPENLQQVTIKGVDVELSGQIRLFDRLLEIRPIVAINYNRTVDNSSDEVLDGYPLYSGTTGLAPTLLLGNFRMFGSWRAAFTGSFTSSSWDDPPVTDTVGGFFLHTARFGVVLYDLITVGADLNNILNERARIAHDRHLPERNLTTELSIKIPLDGKWPWKE